jgi:DNA-binding response OmpR family regulator
MKMKILVVEDDSKTAKALGLRLKTAGYEVTIANDGNEGLILAKSYSPDLVVTDIYMTVGMGFALAYRLREFAPVMPILFITGTRRAGVLEMVEHFGAARLMEKPYNPEQLLSTVAEMLRGIPESPMKSLNKDADDEFSLADQIAEGGGAGVLVSTTKLGGRTGTRPSWGATTVPSFQRSRNRLSGSFPGSAAAEDGRIPVLAASGAPKGNRKKILLVEDDRKIGLSLTLRLHSAGYNVQLAVDAMMGVNMAVKDPPHLLILDISMPAGNGFQVAERVRTLVCETAPKLNSWAQPRSSKNLTRAMSC